MDAHHQQETTKKKLFFGLQRLQLSDVAKLCDGLYPWSIGYLNMSGRPVESQGIRHRCGYKSC